MGTPAHNLRNIDATNRTGLCTVYMLPEHKPLHDISAFIKETIICLTWVFTLKLQYLNFSLNEILLCSDECFQSSSYSRHNLRLPLLISKGISYLKYSFINKLIVLIDVQATHHSLRGKRVNHLWHDAITFDISGNTHVAWSINLNEFHVYGINTIARVYASSRFVRLGLGSNFITMFVSEIKSMLQFQICQILSM